MSRTALCLLMLCAFASPGVAARDVYLAGPGGGGGSSGGNSQQCADEEIEAAVAEATQKSSAPKPRAAPKTGAPTRLRAGTVASVKAPSTPRIHQTSWAPPGTRHPAGLAIDVGLLRKRDGPWLNVAAHFHIGVGYVFRK